MPATEENPLAVIRRYVEAARLEEAIECLFKIEGYSQDASNLSFRLQDLQSQDGKGLLTYEAVRVERNSIANDILGMISLAESELALTRETVESPYPLERPGPKPTPFILSQPDIQSFTGRKAELRQLETAILGADDIPRIGIAGLTGTGGMGKSVLASHFATAHRDRFPDGVIGIRLRDSSAESIAQTFAFLAGASLSHNQILSAPEIMQSVFHNKRALLIFDNAEDALVKSLRPGGNDCAIIVTTRNKGLLKHLDIPSAGQIDLNRFSLEESRDLLIKTIGNQRVHAEHEAVNKIHDLVGGLPLAIRIVGGSLEDQPFTTLTEFAQLLSDEKLRLELLHDPDDPDLDVEASFEISLKRLQSLNETEVIRVFACLGACPPDGFSSRAAQVVSEQSETEINRLLGRLMRLSLINKGDQPNLFILHPLLFLFARRTAEAYGWLSVAEQQHTDFFLNYVKDHCKFSIENITALESELSSLLLAGRRMAAKGQPYYQFYVAIKTFLETTGHWSQALELIDLFYDSAATIRDPYLMAYFLLQKGQFLQMGGDFEQALSAFERGKGKFEEIGDMDGLAKALNLIGGVYQRQGNFTKAVLVLESSKRVAEDEGDKMGLAKVLNSLGGVYQRQGNFQQAVLAFERSKEIQTEIGDERGAAIVLNSLGSVYQRQGSLKDAVSAFEQSKQLSEEMGDKRGTAIVLNSLGGVYQRQGSFEDAVSAFEQSKQFSEEIGDQHGVAIVLNSLGGVYQRQGNFQQAISAFERSKEILTKTGDHRGAAMVLNSLGGAYQRQGNFEEAVLAFERSKEILTDIGDERGVAMVLNSLGGVYQRLEKYEDAVDSLERSVEIETRLKNDRGLAMVLNSLGGAYRRQQSQESKLRAVSVLKQSEEIEERLGNRRGQAMVLNSLGDVYKRLGDYEQAIATLQKSYNLLIILNDVRGQAMVLTALGTVYQQLGELDAAIDAFKQGLSIEEAIGNHRGKAMVLCAWGKALLTYKNSKEAAEKLKLSFEIDESISNVKGLRMVTPSLVRAMTILGQRVEATDYVDRALNIAPTDKKLLTLKQQIAKEYPVSLQTTFKTGIVKRLIRNRAGYLYGFIEPDDQTNDIYFGEESIAQSLLPILTEGAKVSAEVELSARGPRAQTVRLEKDPLHSSTPN
jgi:tetratricopeptide (TPR) repeat protein